MPHRPKSHAEREADRRGRVRAPDTRPSAARRGYGRRWQAIRAATLRRFPLCLDCLEAGIVKPAEEVDHVVPLSEGGTHHASNLRPLCKSCHSRKTNRDTARRRGGGHSISRGSRQ